MKAFDNQMLNLMTDNLVDALVFKSLEVNNDVDLHDHRVVPEEMNEYQYRASCVGILPRIVKFEGLTNVYLH